MKKKVKSQNKNRRVLDGYRKIGTTFVPPMVHRLGPVDYTSWSSQTMPELIWWDVIIDRTSHRFASQVAEEIAKYFKTRDNRECWWAFISDYTRLGTDDMHGLKEHLRRANILTHLNESLLDFLNLYPACPLSTFLDEPPTGIVDVGHLQRFETRMRDLEGKRSRIAVLIDEKALRRPPSSGIRDWIGDAIQTRFDPSDDKQNSATNSTEHKKGEAALKDEAE